MVSDSLQALFADQALTRAAIALLPLTAYSWTSGELMLTLKIPVDMADQLEATLADLGVIVSNGGARWAMSPSLREALLVWLMNQGQLEQSRAIIYAWRAAAATCGDLRLMASCHQHLSSLLLLAHQDAAAIAELHCCLVLQQLANDLEGVARTSWSLGSYAALRGDQQALPLLARAAALAEDLRLPQAWRYRQRLIAFQASLEEPLSSVA
jgi:hypothetical protein